MSRLNLNIFIFNLFFLSPVFVFSYDFKVIQPEGQLVNPDQTASISCEHDSYGSKFLDVRLYRISQNEKEETLLCQKGAPCTDVNLILSSTKPVFTLRNIGCEAIRATYQCEITVEYGGVDYTRRGTKTRLFDFKVIQPEVQLVNPDQTASIRGELDSCGSKLLDVRLFRISQNEKGEMLCQKGASCKDVNLTLSSTKFVFTLRNIGPEAIRATYQCEITVEYGGVDYTRRGTKTRLFGEKDCSPFDKSVLGWILIGLLALMFLYSCVITCLYIRLTATIWKKNKACENSTYVVMKPPTHKGQHEDIYQMMQS
ncbi:uncharacterized protein LOC103482222 [Poecilia reticulata]|uniref:uncharacterized protein LOC103482222 n=1 Tax=Poecilia reticulata TaxID=8081 RepID=UPI0004A49AC1|nr:PREDICTED: uncharacterized protein LOC103482222 [Poecilia reticulata]